MKLILPTDKDRMLILGKTGSGKTRAAVYALSKRSLKSKPWVVLNHKGEELINSLVDEGAHFVDDLNWIPKKPGLYIYQPRPGKDDEEVTELLWGIHAQEHTGLYIDEGYMVGARDPAMQAIFTQGRSKRIPTIVLTQRPVWLSRFAVSEAEFYQIFQLTDDRDRKTVSSFLPFDLGDVMESKVNEVPKLPQFHSVWYDVNKNTLLILSPVPDDDTIIGAFKKQLGTGKKYFLFPTRLKY
jgi:DNA helicase HerA-like ATPase